MINQNEKGASCKSKHVPVYKFINGNKGVLYYNVSYDVASGSKITPCNKIDKPLVVYRFRGNIMTSITKLST